MAKTFLRATLFSLLVASLNTVVEAQSSLCDCDLSKSWNDIMILADASSAMGPINFVQLQSSIISAFGNATIGNNTFQTQVGVIAYSDNAKIIAPLDKYKSFDDLLVSDWGSAGGEDTNILAAVDVALDQFNTSRHRVKSRKVLIIAASGYREGHYDSPLNQTSTFKRNNGVVIVVGYGDIQGANLETLKGMASNGMFIPAPSVKTGNFVDSTVALIAMICNANCFCPGHPLNDASDLYFPIMNNNESWPSIACYWDSMLSVGQSLVEQSCNELSPPGVAAMPDSVIKQQGLLSGAPVHFTRPAYYIGLQKSPSGQWLWDDGRPYAGPDIMGTGDCAVIQQSSGFNVNTNAVPCQQTNLYACQTRPCTTKFYCE